MIYISYLSPELLYSVLYCNYNIKGKWQGYKMNFLPEYRRWGLKIMGHSHWYTSHLLCCKVRIKIHNIYLSSAGHWKVGWSRVPWCCFQETSPCNVVKTANAITALSYLIFFMIVMDTVASLFSIFPNHWVSIPDVCHVFGKCVCIKTVRKHGKLAALFGRVNWWQPRPALRCHYSTRLRKQ